MTVAELIARLQELPPELPVYRYANWECEDAQVAYDTPETDDGKPCVTLY